MQLSRKTVLEILMRWYEGVGNSSGPVIYEIVSDYGEPGYSHSLMLTDDDTPMIVLGSYWCKCDKFPANRVDMSGIHSISKHYPKLFEQLESQGVQFEWHDEWVVDSDNDKCYRTKPDSHSWTPSYVHDDYGGILTPDDDIDTWIEWALDTSSRALVIHGAEELVEAGWSLYQDRYEHGFHPGQTASPTAILEEIKGRGTYGPANQVDVVFRIAGVGQFDMEFEAWVKGPDEEGMLIR